MVNNNLGAGATRAAPFFCGVRGRRDVLFASAMDPYQLNTASSPLQKLRVVVLALVLTVAGGTLGLMYLEDMGFVDSLYMVVITLSTVGFGEVKQLADDSRLFVMALIIIGVILGGFSVTVLGQMVLEGQFKEIVSRRKMDKRLGRLSNHYILAGFGRVGRQVAREFQKENVPFVVVEKDQEAVDRMMNGGLLHVQGDATDEDVLRRVNIEQAHTLVSTLPDEAHNVYLTLTARQMNSRLKIIARADFEEGEKKLRRAGADQVVIPHVIGGIRMAMASLRPNVVDFMQLASIGEEGLTLEEVVIPSNSQFVNKSLLDSGLKQQFGVTIIGIRPSGGRMLLNPAPTTMLQGGDIMVLIGHIDKLEQLNRLMSPRAGR